MRECVMIISSMYSCGPSMANWSEKVEESWDGRASMGLGDSGFDDEGLGRGLLMDHGLRISRSLHLYAVTVSRVNARSWLVL